MINEQIDTDAKFQETVYLLNSLRGPPPQIEATAYLDVSPHRGQYMVGPYMPASK
jgi:hypothetical protein